uniref:Uncharacterized protein n=1 Tax=Sipha flava TaxID=143950 RepID=A0A2S2QCC9_9HEMI
MGGGGETFERDGRSTWWQCGGGTVERRSFRQIGRRRVAVAMVTERRRVVTCPHCQYTVIHTHTHTHVRVCVCANTQTFTHARTPGKLHTHTRGRAERAAAAKQQQQQLSVGCAVY